MKIIFSKNAVRIVLACIGVMLMVGGASAQQAGGTLVMIVQPEPPTLASYVSTTGPVGQVSTKVFDGLLEYNFDLKPQPSLAKSWEIAPDGKKITFHLRHDVKFHDGKPFTSEDVKFTILDVLKKYHPRGQATFREVTDVETPDPYTAIFVLNKPAPYIMMALSSYESPMLPKHIYGTGDILTHPYANKPIGTGAFKFVEWRRGQFMRFDRNPDYWKKGRPYLDRIVARFINDPATRTAAMESGEAHIAGFSAIPYSDIKGLEKNPTLAVTTRGYEMQSPIVSLDFNTRKPPFDNVKVRQAIAYAIDRKFIIDNIWFGFGKPATGPISSNFEVSGLYTADVRNYNDPKGVEIANKLLDEAGYPRKADGTRFEIVHDLTPYGEEWQRFGEFIQQQLQKVGIKMTLRYQDVPSWLKRVYTDYDFQMTSNWFQTLADPVIGVHRFYHSNQIHPGTVFVNASGWSSPETDRLMDEAAVELDPAKRNELYHEFQKKIVEASPLVFVHELKFVTVYNKKFKDLIVSPLGIYTSFADAYVAK
ncbi:Dipeptide-binding protein OS=Afipia felis OX=1035 GN=dppA PE=3 SV=1 [Afipia felis]